MAGWQPISWAPPADAMRAIPISAIQDYLTKRGWVEKRSDTPRLRYFVHGRRKLTDGRPVHYYFPDFTDKDEDALDYPLRVQDFIEAQSRYQDVHPYDIFNELKAFVPPSAAVQSAAG